MKNIKKKFIKKIIEEKINEEKNKEEDNKVIKTVKPFNTQIERTNKIGFWEVEENFNNNNKNNDLNEFERKKNFFSEDKNKPKDILHCPSCECQHLMGKKDFINLKLFPSKEDPENKFMCCVCENILSSQKIIALKKCGHVLCWKCKEKFCKEEEKCPTCEMKFIHSDVIVLESSGTSFSSHNKVTSSIYTPFYRI